MKAVDYSYARPSPKGLAEAGYMGAVRYVGYDARCITYFEQQLLHRAGLGVGYVYEGAADRVLGGRTLGRSDAIFTNQFLDSLGVPQWVPVFGVTVDFEASAQQLRGPIADYARGWLDESTRPVRCYGNYRTLDVLCGELGLLLCGWQCVAWSYGRVSSYACMFQHFGGPVPGTDHNDILMPVDFLWHPDIPDPAATPPLEEDDVTPEQMETLKTWINLAAEQWGNKFAAEIKLGDFQAEGAALAAISGRLDGVEAKLDRIAEKLELIDP